MSTRYTKYYFGKYDFVLILLNNMRILEYVLVQCCGNDIFLSVASWYELFKQCYFRVKRRSPWESIYF